MPKKVWALLLGPDEVDYDEEAGSFTLDSEVLNAFDEADVALLLGPAVGEITVLKVYDLPLRRPTLVRLGTGEEQLVHSGPEPGPWRRFEYVEGKSNKFWSICLEGKMFTTRWGRIGTDGSVTVKAWGSPGTARREYEKMIAAKLAKGYKEVK